MNVAFEYGVASSKELTGQGRDCGPRTHGWDSVGTGPSGLIDKIVYVFAQCEFFRKNNP